MFEYISSPEAAEKWGISERRLQKLCEENRIPGATKFSRVWLIPKDAEKPIVGRIKKERSYNMNNVLIIDDDKELCVLIKRSILSEDIEADFCNTGKEGLVKLKEKDYQLVILDIMMPGMDGFETLKQIREESRLPVLIFTSKIDLENRSITTINGIFELPPKEFDLLLFCAKNQGKILSKQRIYEEVWGEEYFYDDSNIMAIISRLRKKLEENPGKPKYIQTIKGVGYRFNKEHSC